MAYIQKLTIPKNPIYNFSYNDFSGGLNNRSHMVGQNQASDLRNLVFVDGNDAVLETRRGSTPYNANVKPHPVQFVDQFHPFTDADKLVECDGFNLFIDNVNICSVANVIDAINFQGKYFFVDGNLYRVYGKFPQATTTFERIVGTPVADYTLMQIVNPPDGFTPLDTTFDQGVKVYDYTNLKIWYEPCANEIADTYKNGNALPDKPRYIVSFNGRVYLSGSDKDNDGVFLTDVGNPYYAPSTLGLQVPPDSDKILGLIVYDDSIVIGRNHDVYHITGKTNNPNLNLEMFTLKKINTHTGFASDRSACVAHNYLFFLGGDGNAYALSNVNTNTNILATTIISTSLNLFAPPFNFTHDDVRTASTFFYQDNWYVSIKGYVLLYSYLKRSWLLWDGLNARSFYNLNDTLVWGNESGKLMKHSDDYLDEGVPYISYWTSRWFDMNDLSMIKNFRQFYLVAHAFDDKPSDIRLTFEIDYVDIKEKTHIVNEVVRWGISKFGGRFITRNIVQSVPFALGRRGRQIRITVANRYRISGSVATFDALATYPNRADGTFVYVQNEAVYYVYDGTIWTKIENTNLTQVMRVYQINGDYELRGKR